MNDNYQPIKEFESKGYVTSRHNPYFKDALELQHVFSYSIGHLANDLIINVWNTYSTWYMNQVINMSDYNSGLVVLVGQIVDAFGQIIIGYLCDRTDTPIGKRTPWYLFGHLTAIPCFYAIFNPPNFAIGDDPLKPQGVLTFFLIVPSLMNIGQGAM